MTLKINISPETESHLKNEALRNGLDLEAYASKLIADRYPIESLSAEEVKPVRGVLAIQRERPQLFEQMIMTSVEQLPRWSPQIVVSRRILAEGDDA